MTTESKPRPAAVAVRRTLMRYLQAVTKAPVKDVDSLVANIKAVQVFAAQFDELDVKIWGAAK